MSLKLPIFFFRTLRSQFETTPVDPLTLGFKDAALERAFQKRQIERELPACIIYYTLGLNMYACFGFLDTVLLDGSALHIVLTIRLISCLLMFVCMCLMLVPYVQRHLMQLLMAGTMLVCGLGILVMILVAEEPARHYYYAGLLLVVVFIPFFSLFRYVYSAPTSIFFVIAYVITTIFISPVENNAFINNVFFLFAMVMISVWSNYWSDFYMRSEFFQHYSLQEEKKQSDALRIKAEAGSHAKSEFLAIVSHELRTPLNAIIGFSQTIRQQLFGPLNNERYEEYIDDIANSGEQLLNIINNILDLSKAEAGKLDVSDDFVDLPLLVDAIVRISQRLASDKEIELNFDNPYEEFILKADQRHIRLVITNLLSNAVKFTERSGHVRVELSLNGEGEAVLTVEDDGVGIAPENLAKVVEPFVQIENAMSRTHEGTGLGLPLVKRFMELHGGRLEIDSTLGSGTCVRAVFPGWRIVQYQLESAPRTVPGAAADDVSAQPYDITDFEFSNSRHATGGRST